MALRKASARKVEALRRRGCLNRKADAVEDELFTAADFFDPHDLLQVKYEMVRRVVGDGARVSRTASAFGFSRPSVYQAISAFEEGGLAALMPQKPGPRRAHKLNEEVVEFLEQTLADEPSLRPDDLVRIVEEQFGLSVHPRSVDRALKRQEKKRR